MINMLKFNLPSSECLGIGAFKRFGQSLTTLFVEKHGYTAQHSAACILNIALSMYLRWLRLILGMSHPDWLQQCLKG